MWHKKYPIFGLALALVTIGCQQSQASKEASALQELLKNTPDLYRVDWKVCGVRSINLHRKINQGCDETKQPTEVGFREPMYFWGTATEIKLETIPLPLYLSKTDVSVHAFVKSRGCLSSGNPQDEGFYKIDSFLLDKKDMPKEQNFTVQKLSDKEKEIWVTFQVALSAQARRAGMENISMIDLNASDQCRSIEAWKKLNS